MLYFLTDITSLENRSGTFRKLGTVLSCHAVGRQHVNIMGYITIHQLHDACEKTLVESLNEIVIFPIMPVGLLIMWKK